jgi:hypothetical protein
MTSRRYGLILAGLLILIVGIVVTPVTADAPNGSFDTVQIRDNFTKPAYSFSEFSEVPSDYHGPVMKIVNSSHSGQTCIVCRCLLTILPVFFPHRLCRIILITPPDQSQDRSVTLHP